MLMEVFRLANKNEKVIEYIARLNPGDRVSVRGLAQTLGVSEGTAYRSIKAAESQGLVVTRPKVGTVRINLRSDTGEKMTLAEAAGSIGAVCLCGAETAAITDLPAIILGDGSVEQFRRIAQRSGGRVLCLVGDRPDLHIAAVSMKADVLLTGGAEMNLRLLNRAARMGVCVYSSEQDSSTILGMLSRRLPAELPRREMTCVRDWMQLPRYIYHDDMVSEWSRVYGDVFSDGYICAVVDDSLKICGSVDAMTAMTTLGSFPSVRFSELMEEAEKNCIVTEDMTMEELAEKLIRSRKAFASVSSEGGMSGFIGMEDVVRYFQYTQTSRRFADSGDSWLEVNTDEESSHRRLYTAHIKAPEEGYVSSTYLKTVCSAAMRHAYDVLGAMPVFEGGTFYAPTTVNEAGEYMINSEVMKRTPHGVVLELEMFDDMASYLKCTFTMSVPEREENQAD